jgi:hypothetical protein
MSEFTHLIYILTHKEALKSYDQRREKKRKKIKKKGISFGCSCGQNFLNNMINYVGKL